MPWHLAQHLQSGHHSSGKFVISTGFSIKKILEELELVAHAGDPTHYQDTITLERWP
jgi:hypothetical protein